MYNGCLPVLSFCVQSAFAVLSIRPPIPVSATTPPYYRQVNTHRVLILGLSSTDSTPLYMAQQARATAVVSVGGSLVPNERVCAFCPLLEAVDCIE